MDHNIYKGGENVEPHQLFGYWRRIRRNQRFLPGVSIRLSVSLLILLSIYNSFYTFTKQINLKAHMIYTKSILNTV